MVKCIKIPLGKYVRKCDKHRVNSGVTTKMGPANSVMYSKGIYSNCCTSHVLGSRLGLGINCQKNLCKIYTKPPECVDIIRHTS